MLKAIDNFLNSMTMYKLVLYGLLSTVGVAMLVSAFTDELPFGPGQLFFSMTLLLLTCAIVNGLFAKVLHVPANVESWAITALILTLILFPPRSADDVLMVILAGSIAMASKYVLAWHRKHIYNPAAFALVIIGILGSGLGGWWVGSAILSPVVIVVGLLIVRKIRRFSLFFAFLVTAIASISLTAWSNGFLSIDLLKSMFVAWPLLFMGTVMLTEPLTTPPTRYLQIAYGAIVGLLVGTQFHVGPLYSTPELALIVGNVFSYIVSPKTKLKLVLTSKKQVADQLYHFIFVPDRQLAFAAGQYLEWTLPLQRPDGRGNRRYFTIASAPTQNTIELGVRVQAERSSAFKRTLLDMKPGDAMLAGQLAGDFTLPNDASKKLVFIAGGIGITPFRSMIQTLIDRNEKRDIALFYAAAKPEAFAYMSLFDEAREKIGLKTVQVLSGNADVPKDWRGKVGYITAEMLANELANFRDRTYYLSGPDAMVRGYKLMLLKAGVPMTRIHTDYFPGF